MEASRVIITAGCLDESTEVSDPAAARNEEAQYL